MKLFLSVHPLLMMTLLFPQILQTSQIVVVVQNAIGIIVKQLILGLAILFKTRPIPTRSSGIPTITTLILDPLTKGNVNCVYNKAIVHIVVLNYVNNGCFVTIIFFCSFS